MKQSELLQLGRRLLAPSSIEDPVTYLARRVKNIPSGVRTGGFDKDYNPWIGETIRTFAKPSTKRLFLCWSIGSGKTLTLKLISTYLIACRRAGMAIYLDSQEKSNRFVTTDLRPLLKELPDVQDAMAEEDGDRSTNIQFSDGSIVYTLSATTEKHRQSIHVRYVLGSECWMWPDGAIGEIESRLSAAKHAAKGLYESQGSDEGDEFHGYYELCEIRKWHFACPHCDHLQTWDYECLEIPPGSKSEDGNYDLRLVEDGTKYKCCKCGVLLDDKESVRKVCNDVSRGAGFIATSHAKRYGHVALQLNAFASSSWGKLASQAILAAKDFRDFGDSTKRKTFKQQRLAQFWSDEGGSYVAPLTASEYRMADDWDEHARIGDGAVVLGKEDKKQTNEIKFTTLGIDCQGDHFWACGRKWSRDGKSRLAFFEKVLSDDGLLNWSNLDELVARHGINKALIMVDAGDGNSSNQVYRQCAIRGWKCAKGSGEEYFNVKTPSGNLVRRYYKDPTRIIIPGLQQQASLYVWSNLSGKDLLNGLRRSKLFTYSADAPDGYAEQLDSEIRVRNKGKPIWEKRKGVSDNHALDCELLNMLLAVRLNVVGKSS